MVLRIYVHLEDIDYTTVLELNDNKDLLKLKQLFIEKIKKDRPQVTISVDGITLLNENDRPIQVIKDKMDVFVQRSTSSTQQQPQPQQPQQSITGKPPATVTKSSSVTASSTGTKTPVVTPQVQLVAQQLQNQALECFNKKKYNAAATLFEQLMELGVDKLGCLSNLGTIYYTCGLYQKSADYLQQVVDMKHYDYQIFVRLGDSYFAMKDYKKALQNYTHALQIFEKITKQNAQKLDENTAKSVKEENQRLKVKLGKSMYKLGEKDSGFSLIASVLKENEENHEALIEYAYIMMDSKDDYDEALSVLLRCLVKDQSNKYIKRLLTDLMIHPKGGPKLLIKQLAATSDPSQIKDTIVPAIAWVAMIIKEHSAIDQAIELYRFALDTKPTSAAYILNLVHTLELQMKYQEALEATKKFLLQNPNLAAGKHITSKQFYEIIKDLNIQSTSDTSEYRNGEHAVEYSKNWDLQFASGQGSKLVKKGETAEPWKAHSVEVCYLVFYSLYSSNHYYYRNSLQKNWIY
jgi:tetratricopeptide (TPR) repeat protein